MKLFFLPILKILLIYICLKAKICRSVYYKKRISNKNIEIKRTIFLYYHLNLLNLYSSIISLSTFYALLYINYY